MVALGVFIAEREARHLVEGVGLFGLAVVNHDLAAYIGPTVTEGHKAHVGRPHHLAEPVGHVLAQRAGVGLERAGLLDSIVLLLAADIGGVALEGGGFCGKTGTVHQLIVAERVGEEQHGGAVGLPEVDIVLLAATARRDGIGGKGLAGRGEAVGAHVDGGVAAVAADDHGRERRRAAVCIGGGARGGAGTDEMEVFEPSRGRELRSEQQREEVVRRPVLAGGGDVGLAIDQREGLLLARRYAVAVCIFFGQLYLHVHHEHLAGIGGEQVAEVGKGDAPVQGVQVFGVDLRP